LYSISHHLHLEVLRRPPESAAYTSLTFSQRVVELEADQSFGSTGDCFDCEDLGTVVEPSLADVVAAGGLTLVMTDLVSLR
jgi:hypothetical protein